MINNISALPSTCIWLFASNCSFIVCGTFSRIKGSFHSRSFGVLLDPYPADHQPGAEPVPLCLHLFELGSWGNVLWEGVLTKVVSGQQLLKGICPITEIPQGGKLLQTGVLKVEMIVCCCPAFGKFVETSALYLLSSFRFLAHRNVPSADLYQLTHPFLAHCLLFF